MFTKCGGHGAEQAEAPRGVSAEPCRGLERRVPGARYATHARAAGSQQEGRYEGSGLAALCRDVVVTEAGERSVLKFMLVRRRHVTAHMFCTIRFSFLCGTVHAFLQVLYMHFCKCFCFCPPKHIRIRPRGDTMHDGRVLFLWKCLV